METEISCGANGCTGKGLAVSRTWMQWLGKLLRGRKLLESWHPGLVLKLHKLLLMRVPSVWISTLLKKCHLNLILLRKMALMSFFKGSLFRK